MSQPKISVLLCTYNRANYIGETLSSIIAQTYKNWELIIVDNGSTDDTEDIVKKISDPRIFYEKTGRQRMGPARNVGLKKATGNLLAFMDDDDLWMPSKLEKQVAALLDHPEAGFCYTNGYNFRNKDEIVEYPLKRKQGIESAYIFESYCRGERGIYTISLLFWKDCLEKTGNFTDEYFFTDNTFIGKLVYHFKAVILYEPLFKRRLHAHNTNSVVANENRLEHLTNLKQYRQKGWLSAEIARDASFIVYVNSGTELLGERNFRLALKNYIKAWRMKPYSIIPIKKLARLLYTYATRPS